MRRHVTGKAVGKAAPDQVHMLALVRQQLDEAGQFTFRQMGKGLAHIFQKLADMGVADRVVFHVGTAGEWRIQLAFQFAAEFSLKLGEAGKAQAANEAQDGGGTDPRGLCKLGDGAQSLHRVIGQQRMRRFLFRGGEFVQTVANIFQKRTFHGRRPL